MSMYVYYMYVYVAIGQLRINNMNAIVSNKMYTGYV